MAEELAKNGTILAVRTTSGRERQVIDKLISNVKKKGYNIYSIVSPNEIKGYFFVEAENADDVRVAIYGIPHVKGLIEGREHDLKEISMKEIEHFFAPISEVINVEEQDIVELTSGPFKGDKAKVKRVDKLKEEVVVELLEAAVSIPLTVKMDSIRVIRKKDEAEK
ncbi:transcription elongation factor Spt5 [archaeon CG_4_10_14_0_2_um_filter_Archaea_38_6]|nr:MAG: transcription elongation factor Spt5 [archaeon CG07_land_8_20_14_0_80_38_8]PIU89275.1 MAG: transcription elongation factor Spt5 [archaeon CG06_land_8_20_14_3_00_37_11]PJA22866.1 MAG: transcription elongation factor Spt5 [archaeon CG_4_10_14_0_2_um_filter_Archaea_38_6]